MPPCRTPLLILIGFTLFNIYYYFKLDCFYRISDDQRNFNFGGMYSTVVKYIVRAVNFTYNLINSPPVCHLLNNCKESQVYAPIPLRPGGYDNSPFPVEDNLITHETLT